MLVGCWIGDFWPTHLRKKCCLLVEKLFGLHFFHPGSVKVKVEVSHHKLDEQWKSVKSLAFVLDNIPDPDQKKKVKKEKKKKAKDNGPTTKNFGAHLDISKCKCAKSLGLAWRCRLLG